MMKEPNSRILAAGSLAGSSRRQFIRKAAATAVVAATSPAILTKGVHADIEPINIGCLASLTGYLSDQAQSVVEGVELGADAINEQGGLLGRPVRVYSRDDEMNPSVGTRRFMELVKIDGIVMHSGVTFSAVGSGIRQADNQLGEQGPILWFAAVSPSQQRPETMSPKFFYENSLEAYGLIGGEHMTRTVGKKAFIVFADYQWGWEIRDAFIRGAEANGGEIIGTLAVPLGTNDFQPLLTQLMLKDVDYTALVMNGFMFVNCMTQAYSMGLKDRMKFVTFQANIEEVNGCGPEVIKDVILVTDYFWNLRNDKNQEFVNKYLAKYGMEKRPSARTFLHYVSVMMWADAVRKAGTVEPDKVALALLGLKADYGGGMMEIRNSGDHTMISTTVVARGKGPNEMKDKFDRQEIVQLYTGEKYFYSPQKKGW